MSLPYNISSHAHIETRQRLLDVGARLFAEHGYRGVSIRDLSAEAAVNIAAINYHFGGKQGLYQAIFEATLVADEPRFQELLRNMRLLLAGAAGDRVQLAMAVRMFVNGMLAPLTSDERLRWFGVLVVRELAFPSTEFEMIYQRRAQPSQQLFARIVAAATAEAENSDRVRVETHALVGMIYHLGLSRSILWRTMDWPGYAPDHVVLIGERVTKLICNALSLPTLFVGAPNGEKQ